MDATSSVSAITHSNSSSTSSSSSTVDYDAFLQLLITQLENQDPTEPTDNAELLSQLASFSSVEQQVETNTKLDELIQSNVLGDASNLIGKYITSADGATTGEVSAVLLAENGIYAELQSGELVPVVSGTRITETSENSISAPVGDSEEEQSSEELFDQSALY